jgi:hypothetical protein
MPSARSAVRDPAYRWGANTMFSSSVKLGGGVVVCAVADHSTFGSKNAVWCRPSLTPSSALRMASITRS